MKIVSVSKEFHASIINILAGVSDGVRSYTNVLGQSTSLPKQYHCLCNICSIVSFNVMLTTLLLCHCYFQHICDYINSQSRTLTDNGSFISHFNLKHLKIFSPN